MYDNVVYMGKTLKKWCDVFANEFSAGELYRMMQDHIDFDRLSKSRVNNSRVNLKHKL